jgi:ribosomal protein L11 methyltransferase
VASTDNAERNDAGERLSVYLPGAEPQHVYPVVVANILASALDALAPLLASRVESGGRIALSGILRGQEPELVQRYTEWFDELSVSTREDWVSISGVRR